MSLLFWKKNKNIDIFANELANDFYSFVQPGSVKAYFQEKLKKAKEDRKAKKAVEDNLQKIVKQVYQFRETMNLGTYGKARLQLRFNERLKELGYDEDTVARLSEFILTRSS